MVGRLLALALVGGVALVPVTLAQVQEPTLGVVVDRMGEYLLDYETQVFELVADERYEQWIKRKSGYGGAVVARRRLEAAFLLVKLPNGRSWYGFRDVVSVDGTRVPRPDRTVEQVLGEWTVDAFAEATRITTENAKYNIGRVYRTINVPLQALELLHPQNRHRFQHSFGGRARVAGRDAWQVDFAEHTLPSILNARWGADLLSRGHVWVDPVTGEVLKTELDVGGGTSSFPYEVSVVVEYRRDPRLQLLVPSKMEEMYILDVEVLHGRAAYRNYRRFETGARLVTPANPPDPGVR